MTKEQSPANPCSAWVQHGRVPAHAQLLWDPSEECNAEGGGKNGQRPPSEQLKVHMSQGQLTEPRAGGSSMEERAPSSPALLTGLGPWPFWLLGTGAAREKRTS